MKLIVKSIFRDKNDGITLYHPDSILEVNDKERAASLIERGLCAEYKGNKKAEIELSEAQPKEEEKAPEVAPDIEPAELENPAEPEKSAEPEKPAKSATSKKAKK